MLWREALKKRNNKRDYKKRQGKKRSSQTRIESKTNTDENLEIVT